MQSDLDIWLGQVHEEPLESDLPICDAHHHLWDRPGDRYLIEDLAKDASGHNVVSTVFVECMAGYRENGPEAMKPVGETEFIDELAEEFRSKDKLQLKCSAAIISYADLRLGDAVLKVLEAHRDASPSRFQGIRHNVCWDESPKIPASHTRPTKGLLLDSEFRKGLRCVQKMGLLYEVYLYHPQLHELVDLARAFPDQVIILNHFGGPLGVGPYAGMRDDVMALWKQVLKELAACPNVVAKLGGIAMPRNGFAWHERKKPPTSGELAEATAPYYHFTIESFGPDRCMFESNFPVEKVSCSYTVLWNSFKRIASEYSVSEKAAMFKGVAERVYSIGAAE